MKKFFLICFSLLLICLGSFFCIWDFFKNDPIIKFERPLEYIENINMDLDGNYYVSMSPIGRRIQVYDSNFNFKFGWEINTHGQFYSNFNNENKKVKVYTVRGKREITYDFNGNKLCEDFNYNKDYVNKLKKSNREKLSNSQKFKISESLFDIKIKVFDENNNFIGEINSPFYVDLLSNSFSIYLDFIGIIILLSVFIYPKKPREPWDQPPFLKRETYISRFFPWYRP